MSAQAINMGSKLGSVGSNYLIFLYHKPLNVFLKFTVNFPSNAGPLNGAINSPNHTKPLFSPSAAFDVVFLFLCGMHTLLEHGRTRNIEP